MRPDFHVNMTYSEWKEYKKRESEREKLKKQEEAEREVGLFVVKFIIPLILISIGCTKINTTDISNGIILLFLGIIYLSLSIYWFLLRNWIKNRNYHKKHWRKK